MFSMVWEQLDELWNVERIIAKRRLPRKGLEYELGEQRSPTNAPKTQGEE